MRLPFRTALLIAAAAIAPVGVAPAADLERGRYLYESRCGGCHAESVHGREKRAARDFEEVRGWVRRWSANLGLKWADDDVGDVTVHLNARYYKYACPPADCVATGRREQGGGRVALDGSTR
jgi:hypothetical protein